jgi:hypothetical protein
MGSGEPSSSGLFGRDLPLAKHFNGVVWNVAIDELGAVLAQPDAIG